MRLKRCNFGNRVWDKSDKCENLKMFRNSFWLKYRETICTLIVLSLYTAGLAAIAWVANQLPHHSLRERCIGSAGSRSQGLWAITRLFSFELLPAMHLHHLLEHTAIIIKTKFLSFCLAFCQSVHLHFWQKKGAEICSSNLHWMLSYCRFQFGRLKKKIRHTDWLKKSVWIQVSVSLNTPNLITKDVVFHFPSAVGID